MTWEETIKMIREKDEYRELVEKAYFDEDLELNVVRFGKSAEFDETLAIIKKYQPKGKTLLDIGSGNGISAVNFSLKGFDVTTVEPDPSETVGAGAIRSLKNKLQLSSLQVYEALAEDIKFPDAHFDIVYIRQAMHHANDLTKFMNEAVRVLKPKGLLLTIRDHVVFNETDKQWFLENHPLHKYYGGENAFSPDEYKKAIESAGAKIKEELRHYDSVINYFPTSKKDLENLKEVYLKSVKNSFKKKIGILASFPFIFTLYRSVKGIDGSKANNELQVPGRMYSYISIKS
ncbi:MAG: ubiquinone/menaquinone biosynthesis C-methylase UbiE [Ulvibacter sp.]|jgi:ubiquinone/menaquinone biosynthesis C-methylase UbiE